VADFVAEVLIQLLLQIRQIRQNERSALPHEDANVKGGGCRKSQSCISGRKNEWYYQVDFDP